MKTIKVFLVGITLLFVSQIAYAERIVVAGGCFWCVEADFESVKGVKSAASGFSGGHVKNPTYKQVTRGGTGHYEVVEIEFDPETISLDTILHKFLRSVDVTDDGGQFCDRGHSYKTAIFPANDKQRQIAQSAIAKAQSDLGQKIVTPIIDLDVFYPADEYHQDYYKSDSLVLTRFGARKKSSAYKLYREACGRDERVKQLWGTDAAFLK